MRDAFIAELHALAAEDARVLLLSGDIGFKVFDRFCEAFPERFLNLGIAEQNMIGMAAGLSMSGKRPFVYTIIPFLTMRPFEQIRVDLCMHEQPVRLVGVGGGLAYDILGPTHHAVEDIGILRALPNMTVLVPSDPIQARQATRAAHALPGPAYVRLGKNGEPVLPGSDEPFAIGRALVRRKGGDATVIACGPIVKMALDAAELLQDAGVSCRVVDMHTVKPLDRDAVLAAARETGAIVTLEEHNVIGGLGSAVAEALAEGGHAVPFRRIGIPDVFTYEVGSQRHLLAHHSITAQAVADTLTSLLAQR
jgi:transketolase